MKYIMALVIALFFYPSVSHAARNMFEVETDADSGYEEVFLPKLFPSSVVIDDDDAWPDEPNLGQVTFLKLPPLSGLSERVDRLIQGVTKDIAPEFDHYGYEIRRYMATVGNKDIYEDREYLFEQLKNVRKASVIADYWKKALEEEMVAIEKIVDEDPSVSFADRTAFKQNSITVKTFLIVLRGWLDSNERFLVHVLENPNVYEIFYPEIVINAKSRVDFYNRFNLKQAKLKDIKEYMPFAMMVY